MATSDQEWQSKLQEIAQWADRVIVDKAEEIRLCLISVLAGGHVLLEGSPGMGKTSLVRSLARLLGLDSNRIQFTNDMLPADILGTNIFQQQHGNFQFHAGPIFANFVLADEINRATPKTQSACLQAMEEGRVDIDGKTLPLPQPFLVFATQNPLESIGTFPLPESQLDRFLMRIFMGTPTREGEKQILLGRRSAEKMQDLPAILDAATTLKIQERVRELHVSESVVEYVLDLVEKSRAMSLGLSPRASQDLLRAAKANAFIDQRDFVVPEDVQRVAVAVMNHRLGAGKWMEEDPQQFAGQILAAVQIA